MKEAITVQIIGTRKNAATRKAIRYFSERGIKAHLLDLSERGLKPGELENITRKIQPMELIDEESPVYKKGGYAFLDFNPIEELLENPLLMRMPVVRCGKEVTLGDAHERWDGWIAR